MVLSRLHRRRRHRPSRSAQNPYADRGLDTFASLAAELSAKRQALEAKLGQPISSLRFSADSRRRWIPVYAHEPAALPRPAAEPSAAPPAEGTPGASALPETLAPAGRAPAWRYLLLAASLVAVLGGAIGRHYGAAIAGLVVSACAGFGPFLQKKWSASGDQNQGPLEYISRDGWREEGANDSPPLHEGFHEKEPATEPSSPSACSIQAFFSFSTPSSPRGTPARSMDNLSAKKDAAQGVRLQQRKMRREQRRTRQPAIALAAVSVVIAAGGLVQGYCLSILGVVCWWYALAQTQREGRILFTPAKPGVHSWKP